MIKALFFATDPIALPALIAASESQSCQLQALITQPLRRSGRGRKKRESLLVQEAENRHLDVHRPERLDSDEGDRLIRRYQPDVCLVMAYGQIVCQRHLDAVPGPWLNLHGSLLPRWRGAAPIERAIEAGDEETGMMFMAMEAGLDTGAVYSERRISIGKHRAGSLRLAMAELAGRLVEEDLPKILTGQLQARPQSEAGRCYAHRLRPEEGWIDFKGDAETWSRRCRAFDPRPGLTCLDPNGKRVKLWSVEAKEGGGDPGQILAIDPQGLLIACETGTLVVTELQLEGRKRLKIEDFILSSHWKIGERLAFVGTC